MALTEEIRNKLLEKAEKDPSAAIEEIKKDPNILKLLLNSDKQAEQEKNEKIRYVNMTYDMQRQLDQRAQELNTTKGLLIGAAIFVFLAALSKE